jgi:hypothetical protein
MVVPFFVLLVLDVNAANFNHRERKERKEQAGRVVAAGICPTRAFV